MFEIYPESHYDIFDPHDARQVAIFFDMADANAYLEWRNGQDFSPTPPEADWLSEGEEFSDFVGTGLAVGEDGGVAIIHAGGQKHFVEEISGVEAQNLAAMIDAVLA